MRTLIIKKWKKMARKATRTAIKKSITKKATKRAKMMMFSPLLHILLNLIKGREKPSLKK